MVPARERDTVSKPSVIRAVDGREVKSYVGRRLSRRPKSGTNSEFCTLVRVPSVWTSGSVGSLALKN